MAFDSTGYKNQFTKDNYDIIKATVPKGKKVEIQRLASSQGKSVSQIIIEALEAQYGLDLGKN